MITTAAATSDPSQTCPWTEPSGWTLDVQLLKLRRNRGRTRCNSLPWVEVGSCLLLTAFAGVVVALSAGMIGEAVHQATSQLGEAGVINYAAMIAP